MKKQKMGFSPHEAAVQLGISRGLMYHLIRDGTIASVRLGRRLVIPAFALQDMLEKAGKRCRDGTS